MGVDDVMSRKATVGEDMETAQQTLTASITTQDVPIVTTTDISSTLAGMLPRATDLSVQALALQLSSQLPSLPALSAHLTDLGLSQPGMSRHLPPLSSLSAGLHGRCASVPPMMSTAHPDIMATLTGHADPANMTAANLTAANLTAANFTAANLTAANLTAASLTAANFTAANLTAANLATLPVTSQYMPVVTHTTDASLNMTVTSLPSFTSAINLPLSSAYATSLAAIQAGLVVSVPGVSAPPLPPSAQQDVSDSPVMSDTSSVHDAQAFADTFSDDPSLKHEDAIEHVEVTRYVYVCTSNSLASVQL